MANPQMETTIITYEDRDYRVTTWRATNRRWYRMVNGYDYGGFKTRDEALANAADFISMNTGKIHA